MKEIHLFDLPEELYVKLNPDFFKRLFNSVKNKVGKWSKLAKILNTRSSNTYGWKDGRILFSIKILKILCLFVDLKESEVERNVESLKFRGGYISNPKLPILISEDLGVILAALLGDGGIGRHGYVVHYSNTQSCLVDSFIQCIRNSFGDVRLLSDKMRNNVRMVRLSGVLGRILVKTFNIPLGKKTRSDYNIPTIILEAKKNVKSKFLRRLFDDEGNVGKSTNKISMKTTIESNRIKNEMPVRIKDLVILLSNFILYSKSNPTIFLNNSRDFLSQIHNSQSST